MYSWNSWVVGLISPILLASASVNQIFPSGPAAMSRGLLPCDGIGYSAIPGVPAAMAKRIVSAPGVVLAWMIAVQRPGSRVDVVAVISGRGHEKRRQQQVTFELLDLRPQSAREGRGGQPRTRCPGRCERLERPTMVPISIRSRGVRIAAHGSPFTQK